MTSFSEVKQILLVECRKLDHSIVVAAMIHHVVSLLVSGLTIDILRTFCGVFMVQSVELLNLLFYCLTVFCLSPKCNLSETFY